MAGHAFFLEDGVETGNVITNNLGILTRRSYAMLNTDQTPATFWITNPDNVISGNVAAGSANYGFWFDVPPAPRGASANCALGDTICPTASSLCPQGATIREFSDNAAHSNHKYGLRVHHSVGGFWPRESPCGRPSDTNRWKQAVAKRYFGWRNAINGVTLTRVAAFALVDLKVVDNLARGVEMPGVEAGKGDKRHLLGPWGLHANVITGALFVGFTRETELGATVGPFGSAEAPFRTPYVTDGIIQHCPPGNGGRASASGFGCEGQRIGLETAAWHRLTVSNATYANYRDNAVANTGMARVGLYGGGGGWETKFQGIVWSNAARRVRWRWHSEAIFTDLDGTFTGMGAGYFAASTPLLSSREAFPECSYDWRYAGSICSSALRMVRMEFGWQRPIERRSVSVFSYGDNRMAPDCATGRFIHAGSYVQASECLYLRDKWLPQDELYAAD